MDTVKTARPEVDPSTQAARHEPALAYYKILRSPDGRLLMQDASGTQQPLTDRVAAAYMLRGYPNPTDIQQDVSIRTGVRFSKTEAPMRVSVATILADPATAKRYLENQLNLEVISVPDRPHLVAVRPKNSPEGTEYQLSNLKGMSPADFVNLLDQVSFIGLQWGGALAGGALTGGDPLGFVGGGAVGGGADELWRQSVLSAMQAKPAEPMEVVKGAATGALTEAFYFPFGWFNGKLRKLFQSTGDVGVGMASKISGIKDRPAPMDRDAVFRIRARMGKGVTEALKTEEQFGKELHNALRQLDRAGIPAKHEADAIIASLPPGTTVDLSTVETGLLNRIKKAPSLQMRRELSRDPDISEDAKDIIRRMRVLAGPNPPPSRATPIDLALEYKKLLQDLQAAEGNFQTKGMLQIAQQRTKISKAMLNEVEIGIRQSIENKAGIKYAGLMDEVDATMKDLAVLKDGIAYSERNEAKKLKKTIGFLKALWGDANVGAVRAIERVENLTGVPLSKNSFEMGVGQAIGDASVRTPIGVEQRRGVLPLGVDLTATGGVRGPSAAGSLLGLSLGGATGGAVIGEYTADSPVAGGAIGMLGTLGAAGAILPRNLMRMYMLAVNPKGVLQKLLRGSVKVGIGAIKIGGKAAERMAAGEAARFSLSPQASEMLVDSITGKPVPESPEDLPQP